MDATSYELSVVFCVSRGGGCIIQFIVYTFIIPLCNQPDCVLAVYETDIKKYIPKTK